MFYKQPPLPSLTRPCWPGITDDIRPTNNSHRQSQNVLLQRSLGPWPSYGNGHTTVCKHGMIKWACGLCRHIQFWVPARWPRDHQRCRHSSWLAAESRWVRWELVLQCSARAVDTGVGVALSRYTEVHSSAVDSRQSTWDSAATPRRDRSRDTATRRGAPVSPTASCSTADRCRSATRSPGSARAVPVHRQPPAPRSTGRRSASRSTGAVSVSRAGEVVTTSAQNAPTNQTESSVDGC